MRSARVWKRLLGVEHTVVEQVVHEEDADAVVVMVRPTRSRRRRCPVCQRRCPGYDQGEGRRRWRALDLGVTRAFLEADAPGVACPHHGVVVAGVPWARHGAGFTRALEDTCAWLAVHTSRSAVGELLRVAWRTVGRVAAEQAAKVDRLAGLRRIGVDEIAYKKGHRYLTVVACHDSGRLVWAAPGRDESPWSAASTPSATSVPPSSPTAARTRPAGSQAWRRAAARRRLSAWTPSMSREWATDALDEVRREVWNHARGGGETALATELKHARFALWTNPQDLTRRQRAKLARIAEVNRPLYRAYLLKEELRLVSQGQGAARRSAAGRLAFLGAPLPHPHVREAGQDRCCAPGWDRRGATARAVGRAGRVGQHQAAGADPDGVRVPLPRRADRPGDAERRRAVPESTRTRTTGPTDRSVDPDFPYLRRALWPPTTTPASSAT